MVLNALRIYRFLLHIIAIAIILIVFGSGQVVIIELLIVPPNLVFICIVSYARYAISDKLL